MPNASKCRKCIYRGGLRYDALVRVLWIALTGALLGCSGMSRNELPVPIQFTLRATASVNPSISGRPSPVVISVFELRNSTSFSGADFFSLVRDEQGALGEERLSRQEYILQPGETRLVRRRSDLATRYIGVVVAYRDLERSVWRALVPIPAPHRSGVLWSGNASPERRLLITVDERSVSVVDQAGGN